VYDNHVNIDDVGIIQTIMIDKLGIPWHIIIKLSLVLGCFSLSFPYQDFRVRLLV
jgi:hypothetical protein